VTTSLRYRGNNWALDDMKLKDFSFAILRKDLRGSMLGLLWRQGTEVKARRSIVGRSWIIERVKFKRPFLPLRDQLCNVPKTALEFLPVKPKP